MRSSQASSKTLSDRTRALTHIRDSISGGDSCVQFQSEIRALTKEERAEVLQEVGCLLKFLLTVHCP